MKEKGHCATVTRRMMCSSVNLILSSMISIRNILIGLLLSLEIPCLFKSKSCSCLLYKVEKLPARAFDGVRLVNAGLSIYCAKITAARLHTEISSIKHDYTSLNLRRDSDEIEE
jgi:hypothetical protein